MRRASAAEHRLLFELVPQVLRVIDVCVPGHARYREFQQGSG